MPAAQGDGGARLALVTGASSGIGEAIAVELARRRLGLVLAGRDEEGLARAAVACARHTPETVEVLTADLDEPGAAAGLVRKIEEQGLVVDVLVNNAGFGLVGPFAETDLAAEIDLVRVQIDGMLTLTKAFLPGMLGSGRGRILNVASLYAFSSVPNQSVYGGCKAFMRSFSDSLAAEVRGSGVTVTLLCPGITRTAFRSRAGVADRDSMLAMDAEQVARAGCAALFKGRRLVVPGFLNWLYVAGSRILPRRAVTGFTRRLNKRRGLGADS